MRQVPTFFWRARENVGDKLSPLLLAHFSQIEAAWAPMVDAQLACVGSIIEAIPDGWPGVICGAGKLHEQSRLPVGAGQILALRGPLTASGVRGDFALGDPGLLANELVQIETKRHKLTILPHWSDRELAQREEFLRYDPLILNAADDPLTIIRQIGESEKLVTSALHGVIIACSWGIPFRVEYASQFDHEGGTFKFEDFFQSINAPLTFGKTVMPARQGIERAQHQIYDALRSLA